MPSTLPRLGSGCLAALSIYAQSNTGVSSEAAAITDAASAVAESTERSQSLFGIKGAAISRLTELAAECTQENWEGDTIDAATLRNATEFIRVLPEEIPMPEFAPEPYGINV